MQGVMSWLSDWPNEIYTQAGAGWAQICFNNQYTQSNNNLIAFVGLSPIGMFNLKPNILHNFVSPIASLGWAFYLLPTQNGTLSWLSKCNTTPTAQKGRIKPCIATRMHRICRCEKGLLRACCCKLVCDDDDYDNNRCVMHMRRDQQCIYTAQRIHTSICAIYIYWLAYEELIGGTVVERGCICLYVYR